MIKALLDAGADPNFEDCNGYTPLTIAIREGRIQSVMLMISEELSFNIRLADRERILSLAVHRGHLETVQAILATGDCLDLFSPSFRQLLQDTQSQRQAEIESLLVRHGDSIVVSREKTISGDLPYKNSLRISTIYVAAS